MVPSKVGFQKVPPKRNPGQNGVVNQQPQQQQGTQFRKSLQQQQQQQNIQSIINNNFSQAIPSNELSRGID